MNEAKKSIQNPDEKVTKLDETASDLEEKIKYMSGRKTEQGCGDQKEETNINSGNGRINQSDTKAPREKSVDDTKQKNAF